MTTAVQHRRGTTAEHSTFTGLEGEVTIDTTKDTAVIHDGSLAGGYPLAKETLANVNPSTLSAITGAATASDDLFLMYDTSALAMKKISRAELNNAITIEALDTVDINGGTIDGTTIGGTTAAAGSFTTLSASSTATLNTLASSGATLTGGTINDMAIGGTTPAAGAFTTLSASGSVTLSGGTANGVPYLNGSKVLTSGSALTFDGSRLAIGTATSNIQLTTTVNTNQAYISLSDTDGRIAVFRGPNSGAPNCAQIGTVTNHDTAFLFGNSEQMRLTSTGLGIGTSSFSSKLSVQTSDANAWTPDSTVGTQFLYNNSATNNATATTHYQVVYGNSTTGGVKVGAVASNSYSADFVIANRNVGTYQENLRLTYNGNLGLGVTPSAWSGSYRAYQVGEQTISGIAGQSLHTYNAVYNGGWKYINSNYANYIQVAGGQYQWYTAPSGTAGNAISFTQAMTLDASGNLRVGTTSGGYSGLTVTSTGTSYLSVYGATAGSSEGGVLIGGGGAENQGNFVYNAGSNYAQLGVNPAGSYLLFSVAGAERARIDSSGNLQVSNLAGTGNRAVYSTSTGILTNSSSDRSLKENDTPISQGLDAVLAMRPVSFEWVDKDKMGAQREIGFIAQEMQEIVPEVVGSNSDETLSIDYPKLVAVMAKAIQELTDRVKVLEAK